MSLKQVIPLFSIPICLFELNITKPNQDKIEKIISNLKYIKTEEKTSNISEELHLFNKYTEINFLKDIILEKISFYNTSIMGNKKTDFKLTTSWSTKCEKNQESERHKHCNNMYSAVYYNTCDKDVSKIVFYNNNWAAHNYELEVVNYNYFNSGQWSILPKSKSLIIFPSFLYHKIAKNTSNKIRYSIACNFVPVAPYGMSDGYRKE